MVSGGGRRGGREEGLNQTVVKGSPGARHLDRKCSWVPAVAVAVAVAGQRGQPLPGSSPFSFPPNTGLWVLLGHLVEEGCPVFFLRGEGYKSLSPGVLAAAPPAGYLSTFPRHGCS